MGPVRHLSDSSFPIYPFSRPNIRRVSIGEIAECTSLSALVITYRNGIYYVRKNKQGSGVAG